MAMMIDMSKADELRVQTAATLQLLEATIDTASSEQNALSQYLDTNSRGAKEVALAVANLGKGLFLQKEELVKVNKLILKILEDSESAVAACDAEEARLLN